MENFDERPKTVPRLTEGGETEEIELVEGKLERTVKIGIDINPMLRVNMIGLMRKHADAFALFADEMPGINPDVIVHRSNVDISVRPIREKKEKLLHGKNSSHTGSSRKTIASRLHRTM